MGEESMKESVDVMEPKVSYERLYRQFKTTEHDGRLLDEFLRSGKVFPVIEGTEGVPAGTPELTRYGFLALMMNDEFLSERFLPCVREMSARGTLLNLDDDAHVRALRASLIEFALLGSLEAQRLLEKVDHQYGPDDDFVSLVVMTRWPQVQNLNRFLTAQEGIGHDCSTVPSYTQALREIKSGCKRSNWICYIFPQMCGNTCRRSCNYRYYGIRGRMEALHYINHPVLRHRLIEITRAVMNCGYSVFEIFSEQDVRVFRSCINLFASVSDIPIFEKVRAEYGWKYCSVPL